jgi:type II secretion system protein J
MKINFQRNKLPITGCRLPIGRQAAGSSTNALRTSHFALRTFTAFTLIEMILAVGVAALVLAVIGSAFFAALHLREVTQAAVDGATPVDLALAVMRRDLQCVMTPTNGTSKILSGDFRVGSLTSPGVSQPVAIEMFTATGALRDNAPWGDIQKVTYELKDPADRNAPGKDLYRSVTRNIMAATTPDVQDQWMLGGVQNIEFSSFDGSQWSDSWDTTGVTAVNTNLPVAVRVRIQLAGNNSANTQPIEILVPIDSQSRTNAVLNTTANGN